MIRTVVVEDHAAVRAGFAAILGAAPDIEVVGQAADGQTRWRWSPVPLRTWP